MRRNSNLSHVLSLKIEKTPSKVGEFARTVKTLYIFFNVFYALSTNLRVFPISVQWIIMFHLVWKRDPYILDTTWDFGHSDIARSAKWRMKFQMEGTRHSPFNNDKWFANSVQEACAKCVAVHILKFEILQTTWKKHQNASFIDEILKTKSEMFFV